MLERIEILDLGGDLLAELLRRCRHCDRPEPADALLEVGPVGSGRVPKRRDGAEAGDDDAVHVIHDFLSTNFWIALTTSPTVLEFGARIIGIGVVGNFDVELLFEVENHFDRHRATPGPNPPSRSDSSTVGLSTRFFLAMIAITSLVTSPITPAPPFTSCSSVLRRPSRDATFSSFSCMPLLPAGVNISLRLRARAASPVARHERSSCHILVATPEPAPITASIADRANGRRCRLRRQSGRGLRSSRYRKYQLFRIRYSFLQW